MILKITYTFYISVVQVLFKCFVIYRVMFSSVRLIREKKFYSISRYV